MALRLSTGLRNAMMDQRAGALNLMVADTISFGDGTGSSSRDQILDSGNGLAGFVVGDKITVAGDCEAANKVTTEILAVTAAAIEVAAGVLTTEIAGDDVILASARGGSFADLFRQGVMRIFTGTQPTDPDDAESGTLLVEISQGSAAFVADTLANGLNFGAVVDGVIAKETGEVWSGAATATGTAGWFRFYDNGVDDGASGTAIRLMVQSQPVALSSICRILLLPLVEPQLLTLLLLHCPQMPKP